MEIKVTFIKDNINEWEILKFNDTVVLEDHQLSVVDVLKEISFLETNLNITIKES